MSYKAGNMILGTALPDLLWIGCGRLRRQQGGWKDAP